MDNKAQGALEYLLLIGGAVLVAAVVIVVLSGMATTQSGTIEAAEEGSQAAQLDLQKDLACINYDPTDLTSADSIKCTDFCVANPTVTDCPPA